MESLGFIGFRAFSQVQQGSHSGASILWYASVGSVSSSQHKPNTLTSFLASALTWLYEDSQTA